MMMIAQLGDLQFGREDPAALAACAAVLAELKPAAIAVCGDVTQNGSGEEFEAAAAWLNSLPFPKLVAPGNHDVPMYDVMRRMTWPMARFVRTFGTTKPVLDVGPLRLVGLNSARGWQMRANWADGAVSRGDFRDALAAAQTPGQNGLIPQIPVLVCHHPLLPPEGAAIRISTRRGVEMSERVAASPFRAVLTGHAHAAFASLVTHPTGSYVSSTSGTLSVRLRGQPPSFNTLRFDGPEVMVFRHDLAPAGPVAVPIGAWRVARLSAEAGGGGPTRA